MMINIFKGFIIGIAKIIPGVSGSSIAMIFNVYEKAISIVADIWHINFKNFLFLFFLGVGTMLGICLFSNGVKWLLNNLYLSTMLLFCGLITGGIKLLAIQLYSLVNNKCADGLKSFLSLFCKVKLREIIVFITSIFIVFLLANNFGLNVNFFNSDSILIYFLLGIIEAFSSLIPGISGTAIYMSLGCYETMLNFFGNIFDFSNWLFMSGFSLGVLFGVIIFSKILMLLLNRHRNITYFAVLGFMLGSMIIMLIQAFNSSFTNMDLIIGILLFIIGYKFIFKFNVLFANS